MAAPVEIFCCYAREDQQLVNNLKAHLMSLQRQGLIRLWADTDISAGTEWEKEINKHLNTAQIILLLVSPDFMASEYCYSNEMKRSVERHERGEARVIPVILRPVFWQEAPFGKLQALPTNAKPVIDPSWHSPDEAFFDVAQGIYKVIQEIEKLNQIRKISDTSDKLGQVSVTLALTGLTNEVKLPIQQYPYDVALSFAGEDRVYAEALAQALRDRGLNVFYDTYEKSTLWGKNLYTYLSDVYENKARYCVMMLSKHYAIKLWPNHEREAAQARAFEENEEYILPVRLDDTKVPGIASTIAYLSWPPETAESIADTIMEKISKIAIFYEDLRVQALQLLKNRDIKGALGLLKDLDFSQVPSMQRWRLAALRGECYFEQGQFLKALQDFSYAIIELAKRESMPTDQQYELMLLHLHLAATYRELHIIEEAYEHYQIALKMMNPETPFGYAAEAHWGVSLTAFLQASKMGKNENDPLKEQKIRTALEHAENARFLYRSIGEPLRADAVTVQIAQIEKALDNQQSPTIRKYLQEILDSWQHVLQEPEAIDSEDQRHQKEQLNSVSVAACSLAGMALEAGNIDEALKYVQCALQAAERSYKVRQADAHIMHGRILEAINLHDPAAEEEFRLVTAVLADTDRIAARISVHSCLARHLFKKGKTEEGEKELETVLALVDRL